MKRGIWGTLALKTKANCKSYTVKYGTEKYKICNGDAKNVNQRKNKENISLHGRKGSGTKLWVCRTTGVAQRKNFVRLA